MKEEKKRIRILIDNGHGADTSGKRSPDGALREYAWTREIARRLKTRLAEAGYPVSLVVTEEADIPLKTRVRRVNTLPSRDCVLVSIHVNASGSTGFWRDPCGWSCYVAPKSSEKSRRLGDLLAQSAERHGLKVRRQYPDKGYWTQSLAMVRDTACPAVLTENLFMDNREDCGFLLSEQGKRAIVDLHFDALTAYCREQAA